MPKHTYRIPQWLYQAALVALLLAAATLRLAGLDWDESRHLHPDERFLTQVAAALHSVPSLGEYFNTASSTLNPSNAGFSFFVYGTLPVVLVRYVGEWTQMTGYDSIYQPCNFRDTDADLFFHPDTPLCERPGDQRFPTSLTLILSSSRLS